MKADRRDRSGGSLAASAIESRIVLLTIALVAAPVLAQTGPRSGGDAQDARTDALLGTLNLHTPEPLSNLYATAPGLEQQAPASQWRLNLLVPLTFDSNPELTSQGGTPTLGTSPFGGASWATPVANLPIRLTIGANLVSNRYFAASDVDNNRVTVSARIQYVDPNNDQAFSPYFAIALRWEFLPAFSVLTEVRQDFNLGVNKRFNFDGSFGPVPVSSNTSAATVWSFGLTAFAQRRFLEPQPPALPSSWAGFLIPSASFVISEDWNVSFAVELLGRWYERDIAGNSSRDFEALPIVTLEYAIPTSVLGGDGIAKILGQPAIDLQGSHLWVWSNVPGVSFGQWEAQVALKMGWLF